MSLSRTERRPSTVQEYRPSTGAVIAGRRARCRRRGALWSEVNTTALELAAPRTTQRDEAVRLWPLEERRRLPAVRAGGSLHGPQIPAARTDSTTLLHAWSTVAAVVAPVTAGLAAPVDAVRDRRYGVTRRALHTRGERCTLEPLLAGPVHTHNTRNAKLANFTWTELPAPAACAQGAGTRLTLRAQLRVRYLTEGSVVHPDADRDHSRGWTPMELNADAGRHAAPLAAAATDGLDARWASHAPAHMPASLATLRRASAAALASPLARRSHLCDQREGVSFDHAASERDGSSRGARGHGDSGSIPVTTALSAPPLRRAWQGAKPTLKLQLIYGRLADLRPNTHACAEHVLRRLARSLESLVRGRCIACWSVSVGLV